MFFPLYLEVSLWEVRIEVRTRRVMRKPRI